MRTNLRRCSIDALHFRRECALRELDTARRTERELAGRVEEAEAVAMKLRRELENTRQRREDMRRAVEEINHNLRGVN